MRGAALQASIASVVNHTVRLPRARRIASYTAPLVTRCCCLELRCRRSRLALNGMAGPLSTIEGSPPHQPTRGHPSRRPVQQRDAAHRLAMTAEHEPRRIAGLTRRFYVLAAI